MLAAVYMYFFEVETSSMRFLHAWHSDTLACEIPWTEKPGFATVQLGHRQLQTQLLTEQQSVRLKSSGGDDGKWMETVSARARTLCEGQLCLPALGRWFTCKIGNNVVLYSCVCFFFLILRMGGNLNFNVKEFDFYIWIKHNFPLPKYSMYQTKSVRGPFRSNACWFMQ